MGDSKAMNSRMKRIIADAERLGVIGSPSSTTELSIDILGAAATRKLVGEFALFQYKQEGSSHYALGQITAVDLRNVWHEDPTMRSLIRQKGRVDAVSERQDTHLAQMAVSAVFSEEGEANYQPSMLGTVPSTGTDIQLVSDELLEELLQPYQEQLFYLGNIYGSVPKLPMWFKHFGRGSQGAGEAYHLGIFGKTGSGKSALAKMLLLAYARHHEMAILVIDPQGEFSKDMQRRHSEDGFAIPLREAVQFDGRPDPRIHSVRNLVLNRWELFRELLCESEFFRVLSVNTSDKRELASNVLEEQLKKRRITLPALYSRESFDEAISILSEESNQKQIYSQAEARTRFAGQLEQCDKDDLYTNHWAQVSELFRADRHNAVTVDALLFALFQDPQHRPIVVLDLSKEDVQGFLWNDRIQALVIKSVLDGLNRAAEKAYKDDVSLNALVVIDEAHRLAPHRANRGSDDEATDVRRALVDAARTTRKYGLGWLFISQTLSSIDPEIINQLRILFFGFGLSMGQEFDKLRDLAGSSSSSLELYKSFRDPHSSFSTQGRQYSFMTIGPVSPLSFSSTPLFFNAFNTVDAFLEANNLAVGDEGMDKSWTLDRIVSNRLSQPHPDSSRVTQPAWLPGFGDDRTSDDGVSPS
jgi:hypothetical protein